MQATTLSERLADWHSGLSVDSAARLVKNVALTGCDSRNGYRYSASALRIALPLYDNKPVFLDHAPDRSRPHDRSTRDLVGTIVNPRFDSDRIRGDIRVLDTDSGRTFLALTSSNAPGVGMSHVVLARRSADGETIEAIEDVVSVDAVINPATTTTFRESAHTEPTALAPDEDIQAAPELTAAASPPPETPPASTQTAEDVALKVELQDLRQQLAELTAAREQEVHDLRMEALLSHSQLPDYAVTPLFRQQLLQAPDDGTRQTLIQERLLLLQYATQQLPHSLARHSRDAPALSTDTFLSTLKRR
ncbi:MAG: hypothetical protein ACK5Q5_20070 [Planctomycetaceae bacterium]